MYLTKAGRYRQKTQRAYNSPVHPTDYCLNPPTEYTVGDILKVEVVQRGRPNIHTQVRIVSKPCAATALFMWVLRAKEPLQSYSTVPFPVGTAKQDADP